jgi:peptidyl-prolyl cis-trans isomerase B (cyclophilin B)
MKTSFSASLLALALLALPFSALAQHGDDDGHGHGPATRVYKRDYSKTDKLFAEIKTHEGTMKFELLFKQAPNTVSNFVHLVDSGYYKGTTFHRVIQGFMIQGGDPKGDGTGGPGWTIADELTPGLKHETGTLSMANAGPGTGGSQFFVCHAPQPHLDGRHAIFGKMVSGYDVATRVEKGDPILGIKITEVKKP